MLKGASHEKTIAVQAHLYQVSKAADSGWNKGWLPGGWWGGGSREMFNGQRFAVWEDEKALEVCCTTV